jgi:hypothetical protein
MKATGEGPRKAGIDTARRPLGADTFAIENYLFREATV